MSSQIRKDRRNIDVDHGLRIGKISRSQVSSTQQDETASNLEQDMWYPQQRGEEYRYARHPRASKGKAAYQQAIALKKQTVTHAPFYMETLGHTEEPHNPPKKVQQVIQYPMPTRFYPHTGDDALSPIQPVRRAQIQRVLPSYELSTAETREDGVGPSLESVLYRREKRG